MDGSFTFTSDVTNLALASFLLGKMRSFTQGLGQPENLRGIFMDLRAGFLPGLQMFDSQLRREI
jgi:hypothetical protein